MSDTNDDIEFRFHEKQDEGKYFKCISWIGDWFENGKIYKATIAPKNELFKDIVLANLFEVGIETGQKEEECQIINPKATGIWEEATEAQYKHQEELREKNSDGSVQKIWPRFKESCKQN